MRYMLLLVVLLASGASFADLRLHNPDQVDVYFVPLDDFPEKYAADIAKFMSDDMKIWAKSSLSLGDLGTGKLPGTNQYIAEEIIEKSQNVIRRFGGVTKNTYFVLLTARDINSASAAQRFQFSTHNKEAKTSVVSLLRLVNRVDGIPVFDQTSRLRLYKMIKRGVGEMHYGWKRTTDKGDIMYSPLMSIHDIDLLSLDHPVEGQPMNEEIKILSPESV